MRDMRISDHLLESEYWPSVVLNSNHVPLLREVVELSNRLDEQTVGDDDSDNDLHRVFRGCASIASWLPKPARGRPPRYTRTAWDLRALSALIPPGMDMGLEGRVEDDRSGFTRWTAHLHDHIHGNLAAHPSDLEHNAALSYGSGQYGSSWTPNLALARILLAAYLLGAIHAIQNRLLPVAPVQHTTVALVAPAV